MIGLDADPRVLVQPQVLVQSISIAGTAHRLCFASDRIPGWPPLRELVLPLVGETVPRDLERIDVEIDVGGRVARRSYDPSPDLEDVFTWDGLDGEGRPAASVESTVRVRWVDGRRSRRPERIRTREWRGFLGGAMAGDGWPPGWRLDVHHVLDPAAGRIWWGDGGSRRTSPRPGPDGLLLVTPDDLTDVHLLDADGRHVRSLDAVTGFERRRFEYDGGLLRALIDGGRTRFERAGSGPMEAIVAPDGRRSLLETDDAGRLTGFVDPDRSRWAMRYDERGALVEFRTPADGVYSFAYDEDGRLVEWIDPAGARTSLARRSVGAGQTVSRVGPVHESETFEWISRPGGARRRSATCCGEGERIEERSVDGGLRVTEPDGTVRLIRVAADPLLDSVQRVVAEDWRSPGGRTAALAVATTVDDGRRPIGAARHEQFDGPDGAFTVAWDPDPRALTYTTPERRERRLELDDLGRVVAAQGREGTRRTFGYDDLGRLESVIDGVGERRWRHQPSRISSQVGGAAGREVRLDERGRVSGVRLAGGGTIAIGWRGDGSPERIVLPSGAEHRFEADSLGLVRRSITPAGGAYTGEFDAARRLTRLTAPSGRVIESTWEAGDRLANRTFDGGAIRIEYAPGGLMARAVRTSSDGREQLLRQEWDGGLLLSLAWEGVVSARFDYDRDAHGRPTAVRLSGAGIAPTEMAVAFDRDGWPVRVGPVTLVRAGTPSQVAAVRVGDAEFVTVRDARDRLVQRTLTVGGREVHRIELAWDAADRVVERRERTGGELETHHYRHDPDGQLVAVLRNDHEVFRADYDPNGNRVAWTDAGGGHHATYGADDRIERLDGRAVEVDPDGFVTALPDGRQLRYSGRGELLRVSGGAATVEYDHDAAGRRIRRRSAAGDVLFLYGDPRRPFAVTAIVVGGRTWHLLADDVGVTVAQSGDDLLLVATDGLGTPCAVFDSAGGLLVRLAYEPWGHAGAAAVPAAGTAADVVPWIGLAGGLGDPDTGLVSFGHRDYDPATGRWTTPDPLGFGSGDWNLYAYVGNDPASRRDPGGLHHQPEMDAFYGPHPIHSLPEGFFDNPPSPPIADTGRGGSGTVWNAAYWFYDHRSWNSRYGWGPNPSTGGFNICPGSVGRDRWDQSGVTPGYYRDQGTGRVGPSNQFNNQAAPTTWGVNIVVRTF